MTLSSTLSSIVQKVTGIVEWVSFIGKSEQYYSLLLQRSLEKIKSEFKKLSLDNKLAFLERLVNPGSFVLYSARSASEKHKIGELYQYWLHLQKSPVLKQNARALEMLRDSLERNIFESNIKDEKIIAQFVVLLKAGTALLPSSGSADKRGSSLLSTTKRQKMTTFLQEFPHLSVKEKRLILRYLGGNKIPKIESFSPEFLKSIKESLGENNKEKIKSIVDYLFQSLDQSSYHKQLRNKMLLNQFDQNPQPRLNFSFGRNLNDAWLAPMEPVQIPSSPRNRRLFPSSQ